jgi:Family of unknown function (DUF6444)
MCRLFIYNYLIELESRLNQNSTNSNKPPSSDGLSKKPAFPQTSGRKSGGQSGHQGRTLTMVSTPGRTGGPANYCPSCSILSLLFKNIYAI